MCRRRYRRLLQQRSSNPLISGTIVPGSTRISDVMASVTSLLRSIAARLSVVGGAPGIDNLRFRKFPVCMPGCKRLSKFSLIHVFIFRVLTDRGWSWVSRNEKGSLKVDRGELIICLPPTLDEWSNNEGPGGTPSCFGFQHVSPKVRGTGHLRAFVRKFHRTQKA